MFERDPELLGGLTVEERAEAAMMGAAERVVLPRGNVEFAPGNGFGLLVLDGFLCRVADVTGRMSVELVGRGDVLRPWDDDLAEAPVPVGAHHRALTPVAIAVLDHRFATAVAPWPSVAEAISSRLLKRGRWLALQLALTRVRRIEDRLHVLLWHLADRWGHVERDGTVVCPIHLTHDLLAGMVGAQRPTLSSAMAQLAAQGRVSKRGLGWALHGGPPSVAEIEGRSLADAFRIRPED